MIARPGLQVGFNALIGVETLDAVRAQGFQIVRIDLQEQTLPHTTLLAQEVVDAGLQPLCIIRRAEQMRVLPVGALVECGNEPDIAKFGWTKESYIREARACVSVALETGQRLYVGAVSNLNRRGFAFLDALPWREWPDAICCSVHRYPNGGSPRISHSGSRSREDEIKQLRDIVGHRPIACTEVGYHDGPGAWSEAEVAEHMAWERQFFDRHGFEIVVGFQINDGPPSNKSTEAHYGARLFGTNEWKPWAQAFIKAVLPVSADPLPPVVVPPVPPTRPAIPANAILVQFKTHDDKHYLCAEGGGGGVVVADRTATGPWETFHVTDLGNSQCSVQANNGQYVSAELDGKVNANRAAVGPWETWTYVERDGLKALKSDHGKFLCAEGGGGGVVIANRTTIGEWELFTPSAWFGPKVPVHARPLVGPLRVENKLFRDDTGYRRVFFCSWFPALRILRDNPAEFERQIDAIAAAGYQGFRTFFAVGGWSTYWDGREVAPITFQKWFHSRETGFHRPASLGAVIQAWPDYDELLRTLLRACKARGLRLHQAVGDMQIICPDAAGKAKEIELNRRFARICKEEGGLQVMALVGDTNEYPQNRYGSDSPESIEQMGRILRIWEEEIPGVLTTMGAAITEEPVGLFQSVTHGDVCAVHTSRGVPMALKRTHALVHWEGAYRSFPKPFWQGEPMGWGAAVSVDRFTNNADGVALYAMHALTGQASNYFNGPAIHSREPLESTWGFRELPALFAKVLPEDVATWEHGNNGRGIEYWWKGKDFATATYKDWDTSPPKPIATRTLYTGDAVVTGTGTPPKVTGLLVGRFS